MTSVNFEFSGEKLSGDDLDRFAKVVRREYYDADCTILEKASQLYICNARAMAGYLPITMFHTRGVETVTRRSSRQARGNASDIYLVWVPVQGAVALTQLGRSTSLAPGQVGLSSSSDAVHIVNRPDAAQEHLSFHMIAPADLVRRHLSDPKRLCAAAFPAQEGAARVGSEIFMTLYRQADTIDRVSAEALAICGLEAVLRAIGQHDSHDAARTAVRDIKLQRVLDHLKLHHADAELTAEKVAKRCELSVRALHYLLNDHGVRFSDLLWRLRLDSAHQQIKDRGAAGPGVGEIAYATGFKSGAHFSRAFRHRFGCAPSQVRNASSVGSSPG